jgi:5-formyltetrahydrofolate cyclo-ligase
MHNRKAEQRARFLAVRRGMPRSAVARLSAQITRHIVGCAPFQTRNVILLYSAVDGEVETDSVRAASEAEKKSVYYARVLPRTKGLEFVRVFPGEALGEGPWGIGEPRGDEVFRAGQPALAVVPGVAFDRSGTRLGRGLGYYDRALRSLGPSVDVMGLAFDVQVAPSLPREVHDEPVGFLVTETGFLRCGSGSASQVRGADKRGGAWESG